MGMMRPIRLTVVQTHPVQYFAPWFRHVAAACPEIDLTVLYATQPTPGQQGVGFGRAFTWDTPLTEGYRCRIVRPARPGDNVHSNSFWGLDVPEIADALRQSRPDVALIPGWNSVTLLRALWTCRRLGVPVLWRGDTHLGNAPAGWRGRAWRAKNRLLLHLFDAGLSVGQRTRAFLRQFGMSEDQVFDTPHCVDNDFFAGLAGPYQNLEGRTVARARFGLARDDFVVLFVGKLDPCKRPLDMLQAVARLQPGCALLLVGAGPLEATCRQEAAALGVKVSWAGFLNQTQLGPAYGAADCLVLPSESETWGLVVNEAMATGLPCVVSDRVGCAPDLVSPGLTGEVFQRGDVSALAEALARVRAKTQRGHDWAPACRNQVAAYSIPRATAGLLTACRTIIGRRRFRRAKRTPRVVTLCGNMVTVSGMERMTFEVLRVLREHGAAVHCITNTWANWDRPQEPHPIQALAEQIGASHSTGYYWFSLDRGARHPLQLARVSWDIFRTSLGLLCDAWRFRPTHVLAPDHKAALRNAPALALLRLLGLRVIMRLGNAPDPGPFYQRLWRRAVTPLVDQFVANSRFTMNELLAHEVPAGKVTFIYNTVPTRSRPSRNGQPEQNCHKVIYVGQIIPPKGVDLLLDALGLLVQGGQDVRLDVVGDIDAWEPPNWKGYHQRLVERANRPDLAGRVNFLGWRSDVPALLAGAGIHCLPSRPEIREGFGLVVIEAKQAGIPSVVFPSGALPELIRHGVDGWVCTEITSQALAEGIRFFLEEEHRWRQAGAAARASLRPFNRDHFAASWWNVFQGKPPRPRDGRPGGALFLPEPTFMEEGT